MEHERRLAALEIDKGRDQVEQAADAANRMHTRMVYEQQLSDRVLAHLFIVNSRRVLFNMCATNHSSYSPSENNSNKESIFSGCSHPGDSLQRNREAIDVSFGCLLIS